MDKHEDFCDVVKQACVSADLAKFHALLPTVSAEEAIGAIQMLLLIRQDPPHKHAARGFSPGVDIAVVQQLLERHPLLNIGDDHHGFLRQAADNGDTEVVRVLAPHCNCKHRQSVALQWALECLHDQCADILIPYSDIVTVRHYLATNHPALELLDTLLAFRQNAVLTAQVEHGNETARPSLRIKL